MISHFQRAPSAKKKNADRNTGGRKNVTQGIHLKQIFQGRVKCEGKSVAVHDKKERGRLHAELCSFLTSKLGADQCLASCTGSFVSGKKRPCTEWTIRGSNDDRDTGFSSPPNAEPFETKRTIDIVNVGPNDTQWVAPCFVSGRFWLRILATTSDSLILSGVSIRPQIVPSTS
jgi:hypothetical protein